MIYGPNASGKSNLISSLNFLQELVTSSYSQEGIELESLNVPFLLDKESIKQGSEFTLRFVADDGHEQHEYVYRLRVERQYISRESLTVYRSQQPTKLFARTQHGADGWPEIKLNRRQFSIAEQAIVKKATSSTKTVLGAAALMDSSPLHGAFEWFADSVRVYAAPGFESEHDSIKRRLSRGDEELRHSLLSYLREADLGICSIEVDEISDDDERRMRKALAEAEVPERVVERLLEDRRFSFSFGHSSVDGVTSLPFGLESEGTKAMLSFGSVASEALKKGSLLAIDEIDTSLHPTLVRHLVRQFLDPRSNPNQAQLLVTTHDLGLLTPWPMEDELLSRDQVWFVEKAEDGASELYSLADFSPRQGENILRRYLLGQYGAIPRLVRRG